MSDPKQVQQRLMRLAREVDGLTWADRKCIGEAIALIDATQPHQDERGQPVALSTLTDERIVEIVRYSTVGSAAVPHQEWIAFARALLAASASAPAQQAAQARFEALEEAAQLVENYELYWGLARDFATRIRALKDKRP